MTLNKNSKPKHFIIYTFTNKINDKVYIGLTTNLQQRLKDHKYKKSNTYFSRAKIKYGLDNFKLDIIDDLATSFDELVEKEKMYIRLYKEIGFELYNSTDGGEGATGLKMSESTKQKLRLINTGSKASEETKKKQSIAKKGKPTWNTGGKTSENTRTKQSLVKLGKTKSNIKQKITIRDKRLKNGEFLGVYNNSKNAYDSKIEFNGKRYHLGTFDVPEFAASAYDKKAIELYGLDAVTNFPIINYKD